MIRVALIPARGGSKRLPRKNILAVNGAPMLSYPVRAALGSNLFDRVIVSTEDQEIAGVAMGVGAEVLERPEDLAQDRSTVAQVCTHALEALGEEGVYPQCFCCIYATALFISSADIRGAYEKFGRDEGADVVMGVSEFNLQPVHALENRSGYLSHKWPGYRGMQSQFQPELVASNGTLYWARTSAFMKSPTFYPEKLKGYPIPWIRAIDMDTPEDLEIARILAPLILKG